MGPRADFVCLNKKCQQDGAATVYELPVASTRCPVCSSKRIQRLYNVAPGVLTSGSRQIQRVIDQAGSEAQDKQVRNRDARLQAEKHEAPMFAVPIRQLGPALKSFGIQAPAINFSGSRPSFAPALPVIPEIRRSPPKPGPGSLVDNSRITAEGKVVAE
jgi:hypothetical protein